jgi:hypothetical protein
MSETEEDEVVSTVSKNTNEEVQDNGEKNKPKRAWSEARQAAWAKCLEGRQNYLKTKHEILAKEEEEKTLKQKVKEEIIRKKIRAEIEAEILANQAYSSGGDYETKEDRRKPKKRKKSRRRRKDYSSSESEEDETEEEQEEVRSKKIKRKGLQNGGFANFSFV